MARNTFLESIVKRDPSGSTPATPTRAGLGVTSGAGAVKQVGVSLQKLKERDVAELDPWVVDQSFINDRMDDGRESLDELIGLIRDHGQQVPILVRPSPETPQRYQIVYGRRRLRAAAELGIKIKAIVKPLTDAELVVAQGQENSAREDLSFIERALFAATLEQRGFERETIMASLAVDKSGLSRLLTSASRIPRDIINAIGPAPRTGRDRWVDLAANLESDRALSLAKGVIAGDGFASAPSDERFARVLAGVRPKRKKPSRPRSDVIHSADGRRLATMVRERGGTVLKIDEKTAPAFAVHLAERLPEIYAAWKGDEDA